MSLAEREHDMGPTRDLLSNRIERFRSDTIPIHRRQDRDKVYFAFKPEPGVADDVVSLGSRLRAQHRLSGRVSPQVLHMTLCLIGYREELPDERIEAARRGASRVAWKPFEIVLDRVQTFPRQGEKSPLVAFAGDGVPDAHLFQWALISELRTSGFFCHPLSTPHMTLLYDRGMVEERPIDPIRWSVHEFALIHSLYGETRHVVLGQWPLRG